MADLSPACKAAAERFAQFMDRKAALTDGEIDALTEIIARHYASLEARAEKAEAAAKQAREDHHKLGAWPDCPRCTYFFAEDQRMAAENSIMEEKLRAAEAALDEARKALEFVAMGWVTGPSSDPAEHVEGVVRWAEAACKRAQAALAQGEGRQDG